MSTINKGPVLDALEYIREARKTAEMKTASFHPPTAPVYDGSSHEIWTEQVRESTRLWRQTWIISPLDEAILILEKELAK